MVSCSDMCCGSLTLPSSCNLPQAHQLQGSFPAQCFLLPCGLTFLLDAVVIWLSVLAGQFPLPVSSPTSFLSLAASSISSIQRLFSKCGRAESNLRTLSGAVPSACSIHACCQRSWPAFHSAQLRHCKQLQRQRQTGSYLRYCI